MARNKRNDSPGKKKSVAGKKSKTALKTKRRTAVRSTIDDDIFRIIFDYSPIGIELFDKDGFLVNVNKSGLANFGVSDIKELKGFNFFDDPMFPEETKKKLRKGKTVRHEAAFDFDKARKLGLFKTDKTGTLFLDLMLAPIRMGKGKEIKGYLAQVQDITERKRSEEALRASEERYRTLFETANDAIFLHGIGEDGRPGKFVAVNDMACKIYGYSKDEFADLSPADINDPERAADPVPITKKLLEEKHVTFETVDRTKDGRSMPVEISAHLFMSGGKPMILSAVRDITERKKAMEDLRESEREYRNLFESATDGIFIMDLKGNIIDANTTAYERLGYTKDELLSMHIRQLDPPEHAARVPERIARIREKGMAVFESAQTRKDCTVMPVEVNARLLEHQGRQVLFSVVRDITERKEAENRLRESEARFRGAFENAAVGASMAGLNGRFIKVNRFLCEMLGYTEEELLSKTFSDVTHPDDVQTGLDIAKKLISGELTHGVIEKRYVRKDGRLINVVISPSIVRDRDGNPLHFMALFQDVTERKKAEKEIKKSLREKEVLLREIHHRVKNNMAIVSALLQLQALHSGDSEVKAILEDSQNRIHSMAMVHEKLYESETLANVNLRDYVKGLAQHLLETYSAEKINREYEIDDIELDIDRIIPLGLILNELVTNSIKHAFSGIDSPKIRIFLHTKDGVLDLTYSDNGSGLPEGISLQEPRSLGLKLIGMLSRQLSGTVSLDETDRSRYTLSFPYRGDN